MIPAYNVEGWIRDCLESVVAQTFADFEAIIVDDGGTDSSMRIVEEFLHDPRMILLRHDENEGLGPARNTGMDAASGDYILFVDSDDLLEPQALRAIHDRALALDEPELIVFDYCRLMWWGSRVRNQNASLLETARDRTVNLSDHPSLLGNFHVAWNKAYRRDWIVESGVRFPQGYYEDIPWTYPILLAAERIGLLPRALYQYRQRWSGSILKDKSDRHFELFDQYDRMFAAVETLSRAPDFRGALYRQMFDHYRALVRQGMDRIPDKSRNRYYREVGRSLRRHGPADPEKFAKVDLARLRALRLGQRHLYTPLKRVGRLYAGARKGYWWGRGQARKLKYGIYRTAHRVATYLPGDPNLVVYMSFWGQSYSCNPRAIHERQLELRPDLRAVWIINEPGAIVPDGIEHHTTQSLAGHILLGRAGYMVTNVNFPSWVRKHRGAVALQTQHGTPLKFMGLHLRRRPLNPQISYGELLERCARWDYNLSSNPFSTEVWASAFPVPFATLEYGYPRNDILCNATPELAASTRAALGVPEEATLILYTPTHREYDAAYEERLDAGSLIAALPEDHFIAVRAHHTYASTSSTASTASTASAATPRVIDVSRHPSVEALYLAADLMITDYSSTMFDYANLDRPIVLYFDDYDRYEAERGMYFDIREAPPGPVATSQQQLETILRDRTYESEESRILRSAFREKFCPFDDGNAATRVVEKLFGSEEGRPH